MTHQRLRCASCGDKTLADRPHDCWVVKKYQEQDTLPAICGRCGEPETGGIRHWRCADRQP